MLDLEQRNYLQACGLHQKNVKKDFVRQFEQGSAMPNLYYPQIPVLNADAWGTWVLAIISIAPQNATLAIDMW